MRGLFRYRSFAFENMVLKERQSLMMEVAHEGFHCIIFWEGRAVAPAYCLAISRLYGYTACNIYVSIPQTHSACGNMEG